MGLPRSHRPAFSGEEETQWILRCQSGDCSAFRCLVERYEERALRVAYHLVGQAEDAQDIVQDAFVRVFRALGSFRVGRRFYTWFYQIVLHLAIDHLRRRREHAGVSEEISSGLPAEEPEPLERLSRDESAEKVRRLLDRLSPRERAILVLRDIEGLTSKEIAEIIHSNHATVRWWLYLARKQFRAEWERRYGKGDPCI
jgi:RNA polymerase sigma-70 factor (ECF subfamily)